MTVVFKLGGSLLDLPSLAQNLETALKLRSSDRCLVVVGGGKAADIVRIWSRIHGLNEERAHWLALSSLDLNRRLIEELTGWTSVSSRAEAEAAWLAHQSPVILNLAEFAAAEEQLVGTEVPHSWDSTSDSMAAWTAVRWPARELILLKSVELPLGTSAEMAVHREMVDANFPIVANGVAKIGWCNLRESPITVQPWVSHTGDFSA